MALRDRIEAHLVSDWREAHRWASVWIAGSAATLFGAVGAALALSSSAAQWASVLPSWAVFLIAAAIFLSVIVGRLYSQNKLKNTPKTYG